MFKKLVANLPFNPSLITQVGFYTERLKQERSIRRLSFLFIIVAMFIQMFAVIVPPEKSLAASANHIINGLKTRSDILSAWDGGDVSAIYGAFGVTRADIEALPSNPNTTLFSGDGNDYWTIGRSSLTGYSDVAQKYKNSQVTIQYKGKDTATKTDDRYVYHRQLRAWDIVNKSGNSYKAFKGTLKSTGETFWILVDCGNFTKIGKYVPPTPVKPALKIVKTIIDKPASLKPGDSYTYLIQYRNTVNASVAENVVITDQLDTKSFDVVKVTPSDAKVTNGFLKYEIGNLQFSNDYKDIRITVKLKDQISSGTSVCNASSMTASNAPNASSEKICIGVINPCPYDNTVPDANNPNCVEPKLICSVVDTAVNRTTRKATFKTTVTSTNPANTAISKYAYDFGDNTKESFNSTALTHEASHTYAPGKFNMSVVVSYKTTGQSGTTEKTVECSSAIDFEEDGTVGQAKSVKNITQDKTGDAAIATKLQPNDVLEYTLTTTNSQNFERVDIEVTDYVGDILDYATLDTTYLESQGGKYDDSTKKIIWTDVKIPANGEVLHKFQVKIKSPIPSTNSPSTVGTAFDCKISNEYGNEITINMNCPLVKGIETLPNTGPGSSLVIMTLVTTVVGYFFSRSRLLAREMDLIRSDYTATGGM